MRASSEVLRTLVTGPISASKAGGHGSDAPDAPTFRTDWFSYEGGLPSVFLGARMTVWWVIHGGLIPPEDEAFGGFLITPCWQLTSVCRWSTIMLWLSVAEKTS